MHAKMKPIPIIHQVSFKSLKIRSPKSRTLRKAPRAVNACLTVPFLTPSPLGVSLPEIIVLLSSSDPLEILGRLEISLKNIELKKLLRI